MRRMKIKRKLKYKVIKFLKNDEKKVGLITGVGVYKDYKVIHSNDTVLDEINENKILEVLDSSYYGGEIYKDKL